MMRALLLTVFAVPILAGCSSSSPASSSPPAFEPVVVGTRRGERDAVDPTDAIDAGSRKHLAATMEVRGKPGWVYATWTVWEAGDKLPRAVQTKMFNTTGPTTLFTHLDSSTVSGGWAEGTITVDFKAGGGQIAAGVIRVVSKR